MLIPEYIVFGFFSPLVSVFFLIFWSKWLRVLVTGKPYYSLGFLLWGFGGFGSLDQKPKSFSEVVVQNKGTKGGASLDLLAGL